MQGSDMKAMQFEAPTSVEEAVAILAGADGEARILAGGTDLLAQMSAGMVKPTLVVDIKRIDEMMTITEDGGGFRVGAAVSGAVLGEHAGVKAAWPGIVEAVELIGSTQIQGRASAGGNLCNASPAADAVPALVVAGVTCNIAGPNGRREVAVQEVPVAPGRTSLAKGEMVVSLNLPARGARTGDAYLRMIPRTEMDIAIVGVGICLTLDEGGTCTAARVSLGAVAPTVLLVEACADALIGGDLGDDAMAKLDAAARAACKPIDDKRGTIVYRTKVAGVLARRATAIAQERARSN